MGNWTLENFREEIQLATGNTGLDNARLTRYVNFAYFEIIGAVDFDILTELDDFVTVVGLSTYAVDPDVSLVKMVVNRDTPENGLVGYRDLVEYYRMNRSVNGVPRIWTRHGTNIALAPSPSSVINMSMVVKRDPSPLAIDADVSILPTTWDPAISLLSIHYTKMSLAHPDAAAFYNRAVNYMASRIVDEERVVRDAGLGRSIGQVMGQQAGA